MTARAVRVAAGTLALLAALLLAPTVSAQTGTPSPAAEATTPPGPDYVAWEDSANKAEASVTDPEVTNEALETIRAQLVTARQEFQAAQTVNSARLDTLREQVDALGPVPGEGQTEAAEIADRRAALNQQLEQLQVPGLTASEAYRRADGIIREIDRIIRERQADDLLRLWPSPLNPANWPPGIAAVKDSWTTARGEVADALSRESVRSDLADQLPLIVLLALIGLGLILRGAPLMRRAAQALGAVASPRWLKVLLPLVAFGRILLPVIGLLLLVAAVEFTGLAGRNTQAAIGGLAGLGLTTLFANWIGGVIFPAGPGVHGLVRLGPERRAEGRFLATMLGLLVGLENLRSVTYVVRSGELSAGVLAFPGLLLTGIVLVRLGQLLRRHLAEVEAAGSSPPFADRMVGLLGRAAIVLGFVGPALAAWGYIPAAIAIIYPAAGTLAILAVVSILQGLVEDIYDALTGRPAPEDGALVPVLIGFGLALVSVPVLALIWGARTEDLVEIWVAFGKGFSIGETRISPTGFAVLAVVFGIGYAVTRLVQAALASSILPRTRLDQGGQNAIISGLGYVGIFISGLIAVHAAGINLSGLAIVAGALSLGVGFGLKNIVENFVSGVILLIERPVSEGDWIEVGGVQGTVQSISVRSTRIQTFDRSSVIVPNADLVSGRVTNWTRFSLSGRLIVSVSVEGSSDSRKVERVLREIAEAEPLVVVDPAPQVLFRRMQGDDLQFEVRVILSDVNFSLSVESEMNHEILRRFREEGIELAYPQQEVWYHDAAAHGAATRGVPEGRSRKVAMKRDEVDRDADGEGDTR